ncbi:MAG TPA: hypothetical protein VGI33_07315 [Paenibacillus sp.]|jgi:hypothetical protein
MTQRDWQKLKRGCPVIMPSGLVTELTDIQYEHNRYQLEGLSGWQYGIENLQPAEWKLEAQKWRREVLRKYPTPEAYEAACAALEKHRTRADAAEAREQRLKDAYKHTAESIYTNHATMNHMENTEYEKGQISGLIQAANILRSSFSTLYTDTPAPKENEDTDWINEETCARCGRNKPVEGYEWCSECRPDLKAKEGE